MALRRRPGARPKERSRAPLGPAAQTFVENLQHVLDSRPGDEQLIGRIANAAGISRRTLVNVRYGHHVPNFRTIDGIARALGIEPWLLLVPQVPLDVLADSRVAHLLGVVLRASRRDRAVVYRTIELIARKGSSRP